MRRKYIKTTISVVSILLVTFTLFSLFKPNLAASPRVTGERISLISAIIESEDIRVTETRVPNIQNQSKDGGLLLRYQLRSESKQQNGNKMKLSFYVPFDTTNYAEFKIHDLGRTGYEMKPTRNAFKKGFYTFIWSEKIIHELNILPSDLIGFGRLIRAQYGNASIIPIIIHNSALPSEIKVQAYSFIFTASESGRAEIRIWHAQTKSILFESTNDYILASSPFLVQWKLDTEPGLNIQAGEYILSLAFSPSSSPWKIVQQYTFYHKSTLITENRERITGNRFEGIRKYEKI